MNAVTKICSMLFETIYQTLDMQNVIWFYPEIKELNSFTFSQIFVFQLRKISHKYVGPISLHFLIKTDRNLD